MKTNIRRLLRETLLKEDYVTPSELNKLEKELDNLFQSVGIDIEFTRHFLERVNDARNGKEITIDELREIFKSIYTQYKGQLTKYKDGFEAVFRNNPTNINIPFVLSWDKKNNELDLVNKTVMRKKKFATSNPMLYVTGEEPTTPNKPNENKFKKYKLSDGTIVKYFINQNTLESAEGEPIDINSVFEELPTNLQKLILSKLE